LTPDIYKRSLISRRQDINGRFNLTVYRKDHQRGEGKLEWNVIPECLFVGAIRFLESIQSMFFESNFNPMQYIENVVLFWPRIQNELRNPGRMIERRIPHLQGRNRAARLKAPA
jgi:tRNA G37 N-methylase Trm5